LEAQRRYARTRKGLATRRRYRKTEKARLTTKKYLVGRSNGEVEVSVYYWRDVKYMNGDIPESKDVFENDYIKLPMSLGELWSEGAGTDTAERVFETSSLCKKSMQEWIMKNLKPHPHTSMSVGDVVEICKGGKRKRSVELWLCGMAGWIDLVEWWKK
jgi:hypothetical protein